MATIKNAVTGTRTNIFGADPKEAEADNKARAEAQAKEQEKRADDERKIADAVEKARQEAYDQGLRDGAAATNAPAPATPVERQAAEIKAFAAVHTPGDNLAPPPNPSAEGTYFPDNDKGDDTPGESQSGDAGADNRREPRTEDQETAFAAVADVVGERAARIFAAEGLTSLADLDASSDDRLIAIEQIGQQTIDKLRSRKK